MKPGNQREHGANTCSQTVMMGFLNESNPMRAWGYFYLRI